MCICSYVSPLSKSVLLNLSLLYKSRSAIDPSNFLRALQCKMSSIRGAPFNINTQQDVPEILLHILDELTGPSVIANNSITNILTTTMSCNSCLFSSSREERMTIVPLATSSSVANSFHLFFQPEELTGNDMWLCPQCSSLQDSTRETAFSQCGDLLILQLKRFTCVEGRSVKNNQFVNCISHSGNILEVPSHPADDVSFTNKYKLVATINHSGTLAAGHYWAFIKDRNVDEWLKCDDRAVVKVKPSDINNSTVYVLFFLKL